MPDRIADSRGDVDLPPGNLPLQFTFTRRAKAVWRRGRGAAVELRDLDLHGASGGVLGAQHVRAANGKAGNRPGWYSGDLDFFFLQVLKGELCLEGPDGKEVKLGELDTLFMPPFLMNREVYRFSADFEALEITGTGAFDFIDKANPGLAANPVRRDHTEPVISRHRPEDYVTGDGPRSFFRYRDTGARAMTGARMHIHVVGPVAGAGGGATGWHHHSMDQFYMVVTGTARNNLVACGGQVDLAFTDTMSIPAFMRHNFSAYSEGYLALEVCIPAEYETTPADPPPGAA
jgi:mannose-6-phosphate isomerase-like protein (cupin superfamily)